MRIGWIVVAVAACSARPHPARASEPAALPRGTSRLAAGGDLSAGAGSGGEVGSASGRKLVAALGRGMASLSADGDWLALPRGQEVDFVPLGQPDEDTEAVALADPALPGRLGRGGFRVLPTVTGGQTPLGKVSTKVERAQRGGKAVWQLEVALGDSALGALALDAATYTSPHLAGIAVVPEVGLAYAHVEAGCAAGCSTPRDTWIRVGSDLVPRLPVLASLARITATSQLPDAGQVSYDPTQLLHPRTKSFDELVQDQPPEAFEDELVDDVLWQSAWCEGKPGPGIGEAVTLQLGAPARVGELRIAAGRWETRRQFQQSNRPTRLGIETDTGKRVIDVPATRTWAKLRLEQPTSRVTVRLLAVQRGHEDDSCLTAIELPGLKLLEGMGPTQVSRLPAALARIAHALTAQDRAELAANVAFPMTWHPVDGFFTGDNTTYRYRDVATLLAACARADEAADRDEVNRKWPCPASPFRSGTSVRVSSAGKDELIACFPDHREVATTWKLAWRKGHWMLIAADYAGNCPS